MKYKPISLEEGYSVECDNLDEYEWNDIFNQFADSNIYQTWPYNSVRHGVNNLSHTILKYKGKVVSASQARIVKFPIGGGLAYIRWAPLWKLLNTTEDIERFRMSLRALRNEYVLRRHLLLRIFPIVYNYNSKSFSDIFLQEGFRPSPNETPPRTFLLDIRPSLEDIRKNFNQKWRNCLNKSERNEIDMIGGTEDYLFANFIDIYNSLLKRKQFKEPNDINEFRMIQNKLPLEHKMMLFICESNGSISAGGIFTAIGDTGVYLFGATNSIGMKDKSSYAIQWKAIQWMKSKGCHFYNLNGINPETNPGGYHFKKGVAGKQGKDIKYLGRFDCYPLLLNSLLNHAGASSIAIPQKLLSLIRQLL